jgi:hypothetical protein
MFAPKPASATYDGSNDKDFAEMEDILKLTLIANSIDLEKLEDLSTKDYDALNAKAMLIIYSHVSGPARSHLHGISTAIGLLAKLREVYSNSNPISLKILRDEYQACEIEDDQGVF